MKNVHDDMYFVEYMYDICRMKWEVCKILLMLLKHKSCLLGERMDLQTVMQTWKSGKRFPKIGEVRLSQ